MKISKVNRHDITETEINDNYIKQYFILNANYAFKYKMLNDDEIKYIINRYSDSLSLKESVYRIINDIEIRPICKSQNCNNPVKFTKNGFNLFCSQQCYAKNDSNFSKQHVKDKIKQTCLERYGVENGGASEISIQKAKNTFIKKYGVSNPNKTSEVRNKIKQTCLERYGVEHNWQSEQSKQSSKQTCLERYGVEYTFQSENNKLKSKQTWLSKYGVDHPLKSDIVKSKIDYNLMVKHINETKRKNNSFNISKQEDECYALLKEKYHDVIRQYMDERYPFNCDFYVPSFDLFIEFNCSQYHQNHPFDKDNEQDIIILEELKLKANLSKRHNEGKLSQYDNIIKTWTIRDVNKRNIAKQNKLNYIEFWNLDEVKLWLQQN